MTKKYFFAAMTACIFTLTALLSCANEIDDINEDSFYTEAEKIQLSGKIDIKGALAAEYAAISQNQAAGRAALPSLGSFSYYMEDNGSELGELSITDGAYSLPLVINKNYILKVLLKNGSTDVLCSDEWEVSPSRSNTATLQHDFILKPLASGSGDVELILKIESDKVAKVKTVCDNSAWGNTEDAIDTAAGSFTLAKSGIAGGSYDVTFDFLNSKGLLIYARTETINVFPNLTTDTWKSSGASLVITNPDEANHKGLFKITDDLINSFGRTQIYVGAGDLTLADGSNVSASDTKGNGSPYAPFASVTKAVEFIATYGEKKDYTIWINGALKENAIIESTITTDKAKSITIKGCHNNNLDNPDSPVYEDKIYDSIGTPSSILTISSPVPVTIENLMISSRNSTASGGGLYIYGSAQVTLGKKALLYQCESKGDGGAIYMADASPSVTMKDGAVISNCRAKRSGNSGDYRRGGALFMNSGNFYMEGGLIHNNYADYAGGIYCMHGNIYVCGNANITNNGSNEFGGAIHGGESDALIYLGWKKDGERSRWSGKISGNSSRNGGAFYFRYGKAYMNSGTIENNEASYYSSSKQGGAICGGGNFYMSGSAYIPYGCYNDDGELIKEEYMNDISGRINVIGELTPPPEATQDGVTIVGVIAPGSGNLEGRLAVAGTAEDVEKNYQLFGLVDSVNYMIKSDGTITKAQLTLSSTSDGTAIYDYISGTRSSYTIQIPEGTSFKAEPDSSYPKISDARPTVKEYGLEIPSGKTVRLSGNGTLDLGYYNGGGYGMLVKGKLIIDYSVTITSSCSLQWYLIKVESGGELEMNGGTIDGNNMAIGGGANACGIYGGGTVSIKGGTIKNFTPYDKPILIVNKASTMTGGTFTGNKSIAIGVNSDFTMSGGEIINNENYGVQVYADKNFTMTGGKIAGNTKNSEPANCYFAANATYNGTKYTEVTIISEDIVW